MKTKIVILNLLIFITSVYCRSYYDILGIEKDASHPKIKKAFRNLALLYHPDKNSAVDAENKFREIAEAYEVLSNKEKRRKYDAEGQTNGQNGQHHHHDFNYEEFYKKFDEAHQRHMKNHFQRHQEAVNRANNMHQKMEEDMFDFDSLFDDGIFADGNEENIHVSEDFGGLDLNGENVRRVEKTYEKNGQRCRTVKTKSGNTVTSETICESGYEDLDPEGYVENIVIGSENGFYDPYLDPQNEIEYDDDDAYMENEQDFVPFVDEEGNIIMGGDDNDNYNDNEGDYIDMGGEDHDDYIEEGYTYIN